MADGVTVALVRHAKAGDRTKWTPPDVQRPLTRSGRRQAEALVDVLRSLADFERVLSSPAVRCSQTVGPFAEAIGLELEEHQALAEGAGPHGAIALVRSATTNLVLCTHGDVICEFVAELGVDPAEGRRSKKGSLWRLEVSDATVRSVTYVAPPT